MRRNLIVLFCLVFCGFLSSVYADNINVSYTATGKPGDWTLNFSVDNNLIGTIQGFYFFGVVLNPDSIIVGTPKDQVTSIPWVYPRILRFPRAWTPADMLAVDWSLTTTSGLIRALLHLRERQLPGLM